MGGIGVGIGDFALLAELAGARHVEGVDEEGRGGGGQDEAAVCILARLLVMVMMFFSWCFCASCSFSRLGVLATYPYASGSVRVIAILGSLEE